VVERKPPGVGWETWVDAQVARAREQGAFDDLPGAGKPIPGLDRERGTYEWALDWARRESLDPADMLPPGLALRRRRERLPGQVERLRSEAAVRALAADFNAEVDAFHRRPQDGPPVVVGYADADALVAHWRATRPPRPKPLPEPAAPPRRRRQWWWQRRR
jgi:hypothetical protein